MKISTYSGAIVLMFALLSAVSCERYYTGLPDDEDITTRKVTPEMVTILVGDYGKEYVDTKNVGAVISRWNWAQSIPDMKVYAFRKDSACLNITPSDKSGNCLIDGSIDSVGMRSGRTATFTAPEYVVTWPLSDKELRYPSENTPYHFFAYHTGNCKVPESKIDRTASYISFPVKIDGATDLMYGESNLTSSQLEMLPYLGISSKDSAAFTNLCYSNYSASLGIIPVLNFKHSLTRICFDLYPGERGCNEIIVERVSVTTRDSCIFTVASTDSLLHPMGADFSIDEKDTVLDLLEEDGSHLNDTLYHTRYKGDFSEDILLRPHIRIGGCFLLPPEDEYKFEFYTRKIGSDFSVRTEIMMNPSKSDFNAGSVYVVRMAIYDLIPIVFNAGPAEWI